MTISPIHTVPSCVDKWGYDHCPVVYRKPDPYWQTVTGTGSWLSGMQRLVAGWNGESFSRGPDSIISLDGISIGPYHYWSKKLPELLSYLIRRHPELAAYAFGQDVASQARSELWLEDKIPVRRGKGPLRPEYRWIAAGWYEIARHPEWLKSLIDRWVADYVGTARRICNNLGWDTGRALAGVTRLANSGATGDIQEAIDELGTTDADDVLEYVYDSEHLYDHPERWDRIKSWSEFSGAAPATIDVSSDLDWRPQPVRVDGTLPAWSSGQPIVTRKLTESIPLWLKLIAGFGVGFCAFKLLKGK